MTIIAQQARCLVLRPHNRILSLIYSFIREVNTDWGSIRKALSGFCPYPLAFHGAIALGLWILACFKCCLASLCTRAASFWQSMHFRVASSCESHPCKSWWHLWDCISHLVFKYQCHSLHVPYSIGILTFGTVCFVLYPLSDNLLLRITGHLCNYFSFSLPYSKSSEVPIFMEQFEHSISIPCYFLFNALLIRAISLQAFIHWPNINRRPNPLWGTVLSTMRRLTRSLTSWNSILVGEIDSQRII